MSSVRVKCSVLAQSQIPTLVLINAGHLVLKIISFYIGAALKHFFHLVQVKRQPTTASTRQSNILKDCYILFKAMASWKNGSMKSRKWVSGMKCMVDNLHCAHRDEKFKVLDIPLCFARFVFVQVITHRSQVNSTKVKILVWSFISHENKSDRPRW